MTPHGNSEITVIMPVRNEAAHLARALESLSAQSHAGFLCLCHDDGSTDGSLEILRAHARRDRRFHVTSSPHPEGIPATLNRLLSGVATPWTARMDGDDVCAHGRLALQLEAARQNPAIVLWGAMVEAIGEPSEGWRRYVEWLNSIITPDEISLNAFTDNPIPHPTWLVRTEALRQAGGYRDGLFPEDYDLLLRLLAGGAPMAKVARPLVGWRDHPARETRQSPRCDADNTLAMKAAHFALRHRSNSPGRKVAVRGAGKTGRILARALARSGLTPACFIDPDKAGQRIEGLDTVAPGDRRAADALVLVAVRPRRVRETLAEEFLRRGLALGSDYLWFY